MGGSSRWTTRSWEAARREVAAGEGVEIFSIVGGYHQAQSLVAASRWFSYRPSSVGAAVTEGVLGTGPGGTGSVDGATDGVTVTVTVVVP